MGTLQPIVPCFGDGSGMEALSKLPRTFSKISLESTMLEAFEAASSLETSLSEGMFQQYLKAEGSGKVATPNLWPELEADAHTSEGICRK